MTKHFTFWLGLTVVLVAAGSATAETFTFTELTGTVGGQVPGTAIFRADLTSLVACRIKSLTITDTSGGTGGFTGQFSGFDLDAIKLATTSVDNAADASNLVGLSVFNFSSTGTTFTGGTQRPTTDPKLFGTDPTGLLVDPVVDTLGAFDANATTLIPLAKGFITLGDAGSITFNLSNCVVTNGMFLYIGEVGGNGETANGSVLDVKKARFNVSFLTVAVPEPGSLALMAGGMAGLAALAYRRRRAG